MFKELQHIVASLDADPSLLDDFEHTPYYKWDRGPKKNQPAAFRADRHDGPYVAHGIMLNTAALYGFAKLFKHERITLCTTVDTDGTTWLKGRGLALASWYTTYEFSIQQTH